MTKLLQGNQVEVEIEDGFRIPVMRNEVVAVQDEEGEFFGHEKPRKQTAPEPVPQPSKHQQLVTKADTYIAFVPFNDQEMSLYLINYTDSLLLYSFGTGTGSQYKGLRADMLNKNKAIRLLQLPLQSLKDWPPLVFQLLWHDKNSLQQPIQRVFQQFSPKTFFKDKKTVPVLLQEGVLFSLSASRPPSPKIPAAESLRETILSNAQSGPVLESIVEVPDQIDLHIEQLTEAYESMSNAEMITLQLETFEKTLDQAVVSNKDEITFIHGVGKGKLRMEIHRRLSQHPNVAYYQDAQRSKFGYGATHVKFK